MNAMKKNKLQKPGVINFPNLESVSWLLLMLKRYDLNSIQNNDFKCFLSWNITCLVKRINLIEANWNEPKNICFKRHELITLRYVISNWSCPDGYNMILPVFTALLNETVKTNPISRSGHMAGLIKL